MLEWPQIACPQSYSGEPSANLLLRQLDPRDRAALEPQLHSQPVTRGDVLFSPMDISEHVYFPQQPMISLEQCNNAEVALIGREGIVGSPALVGCVHSPYRAVVRGRDGQVLRIRTNVLMAIAASHPALALLLNRFAMVISVQMAETIGAYAFHRIDMRLARWLLLRHDRVAGDEILAQHDEIAANLGARRASITDCLHIIEGEGLVRCRRGRIVVRDRAGLEALAANCYGSAESVYRDMIGKFGKAAGRPPGSAVRFGEAVSAPA